MKITEKNLRKLIKKKLLNEMRSEIKFNSLGPGRFAAIDWHQFTTGEEDFDGKTYSDQAQEMVFFLNALITNDYEDMLDDLNLMHLKDDFWIDISDGGIFSGGFNKKEILSVVFPDASDFDMVFALKWWALSNDGTYNEDEEQY